VVGPGVSNGVTVTGTGVGVAPRPGVPLARTPLGSKYVSLGLAYTQALAEAHLASWDILRMPEHSRTTGKELNVLPVEDVIRARMGYNPLPA